MPDLPHLHIKADFEHAEAMVKHVMKESNVIVALFCFSGRMWCRISGSVFNTEEDYDRLREALLTTCKML